MFPRNQELFLHNCCRTRSAGTVLHYVILHRRNTKSSDRSVPRASALMRMSFLSKHLCLETRTSWSELGWNGSFLQSCPSISVVFPGNYVALFSVLSYVALAHLLPAWDHFFILLYKYSSLYEFMEVKYSHITSLSDFPMRMNPKHSIVHHLTWWECWQVMVSSVKSECFTKML